MTLNLPSDIAIQGRTFGTPRVGNDAFVQLFDSKVILWFRFYIYVTNVRNSRCPISSA